ncbi:OPT oligopeptide transporter protein-domain-containing protein [Mycena epipterygia]|nr:OPT oligopeptide transporter protein-domain-containing protein [Mycena epipterygia]
MSQVCHKALPQTCLVHASFSPPRRPLPFTPDRIPASTSLVRGTMNTDTSWMLLPPAIPPSQAADPSVTRAEGLWFADCGLIIQMEIQSTVIDAHLTPYGPYHERPGAITTKGRLVASARPTHPLEMASLAHEHVLPRDPQVLVVDEKFLQEDDDPIKSELRSESIGSADTAEKYESESEEFRDIPELVRSIMSFEDDQSLPVTTFRSVSLAIFFITLGSTSDPMGRFMARTLLDYIVPLGRFTFSLLYYGIDYSPAVSLFFGWGAALIGFSFVAICRQLLIYDPTYIFPLSLQQVTLYRSMKRNGKEGSERDKQLMKFLLEYALPFTVSLTLLCWFASRNHTVNFLGSGIGGVGLLNITLDWSNITYAPPPQSTVITFPYSVQVIVFVAPIIWLLVPIAYFGNLWGSSYNIMSNGLFKKNGSSYPFSSLRDKVDGQQYDEVGLAYAGAQYMWGIFFCACLPLGRVGWASNVAHNEWIAMFTIPFVILLVVVIKGGIYMPLFTHFIGLAFGGAATLPMASIYALSAFMLLNMIDDVKGSSRHPLGQLAYPRAKKCLVRLHPVLENQKVGASHISSLYFQPTIFQIGHYLHIPPRQVIGIQIMAAFIGFPINYGVMRWILDTKLDYLTGVLTDPSGQWTAQELKSYNTAGIQYTLVGPIRLFSNSVYHPSPTDSVGAVAPFLVWLAHRRFPRWQLNKWNTTIFASSASFGGNISTGPFTSIIIGTMWDFWLFRYRHHFWKMWRFNANLLFIFVAFGSTGGFFTCSAALLILLLARYHYAQLVGNNAQSTERCFYVKK